MVTVCGMVLRPTFHISMCFYLPMCAHGKHISLSLCLSDSVKNALLCINKNDRDKIKPYWVLLPFSYIAILEIFFVIICWCARLKANQKKKSPCLCVCRLHVELFGSCDNTMQCTSKGNVLLQITWSSYSYRHLPNYIRSKKTNSFLKPTKSCSESKTSFQIILLKLFIMQNEIVPYTRTTKLHRIYNEAYSFKMSFPIIWQKG